MRTRTTLKTLADYRLSFDLRNEAHHPSMPGNMTRVPDSFLPGRGRARLCYVIQEEPSCDVPVDDNGNDQKDEVTTTSNRALSANQNRNDVKKDNEDNTRTNDNMVFMKSSSNLVNLNENINSSLDNDNIAALSWPSARTLSSNHIQLSTSSRTIDESALTVSSFGSSFHEEHPQSDTPGRGMAAVKSGHLVLIVSDHISKFALLDSDMASPRTGRPQRCPVIVKIGGQGYEKYAIISSTRRRRGSQSVCLKLKHSHATQSASCPSRFTVILDGDDGKTFTFEAGSAEVASDWTRAFSSSCYCPKHRTGSQNQSHARSGQPSRAAPSSSGHVPVSPMSSPPLTLSHHLPLMPVLSESLDEDDEE